MVTDALRVGNLSGTSGGPNVRYAAEIPGFAEAALGRAAPVGAHRPGAGLPLYLGLLCHLQGIVLLDAEVTDRAFQLGMSEKQLDRARVLGPAVDPSRLRPPQRVWEALAITAYLLVEPPNSRPTRPASRSIGWSPICTEMPATVPTPATTGDSSPGHRRRKATVMTWIPLRTDKRCSNSRMPMMFAEQISRRVVRHCRITRSVMRRVLDFNPALAA
jgi:hypothetical protein